jgi:hypothetical protein
LWSVLERLIQLASLADKLFASASPQARGCVGHFNGADCAIDLGMSEEEAARIFVPHRVAGHTAFLHRLPAPLIEGLPHPGRGCVSSGTNRTDAADASDARVTQDNPTPRTEVHQRGATKRRAYGP